eukprot:3658041-Amphidinium_carterae.1
MSVKCTLLLLPLQAHSQCDQTSYRTTKLPTAPSVTKLPTAPQGHVLKFKRASAGYALQA